MDSLVLSSDPLTKDPYYIRIAQWCLAAPSYRPFLYDMSIGHLLLNHRPLLPYAMTIHCRVYSCTGAPGEGDPSCHHSTRDQEVWRYYHL